MTSPVLRFFEMVTIPDDIDQCWTWNGATTGHGYGTISVDGKQTQTHRYAYELFVGRIPDGAVVMHSCDNPPCVNPRHLSAGSYQDNLTDAINKGRWVCPTVKYRHDLNGKTTVISARIPHDLGQRIRALAKIRNLDRQDVVIDGLLAEMDNATPAEHAEIERRLAEEVQPT